MPRHAHRRVPHRAFGLVRDDIPYGLTGIDRGRDRGMDHCSFPAAQHISKPGVCIVKAFMVKKRMRKPRPAFANAALLVTLALCTSAVAQTSRWSEAKANAWYAR